MRIAVLAAVALFLATLVGTTLAARFDDEEAATPAPRSTATSAAPGTVPAPVAGGASTATGTAVAQQPGYTYDDVARHASSADCWIVVGGRVFDVTSYLRSHPGGASTITPWCGKESTVAYETEDGQGTHSSRADGLLEQYYIGDLR